MRVLVLALGVPFPPIGGGLTRTFHLLKALASRHDVSLAAFTYGEIHETPPYPVQVRAVPWQWSADYQRMIGADADAAHRTYGRLAHDVDEPWFASVMDPFAMEAAIADALTDRPDLVLFEGTPLARFLSCIPDSVPRVVDFFDIHSVMARDAANAPGAADPALAREAERTLEFERRAVRAASACLAVSEHDAAIARELLGATSVTVIPNGVDTSYFTPSSLEPEGGGVVFTGRMSYPPNAEAASFFATKVMPLVRRDFPAARFHVVGSAPPPEVYALTSDAVVVHGHVEDVRPFLWRAEVVVAPIRSGGGTRLKVLEAAACARAVVSTTLGAQGLPFVAGHDIEIADDPVAFATAVVTLLRDAHHRTRLAGHARITAEQFDWEDIGDAFNATIDRLVSGRG
ncbi:MAG TPA: glycosyltransferase [Vicinamibacterales bacterium]